MKKFTTSLSAIATISIVWYLFTSLNVISNWWSLPLLAVLTGISSILLPVLLKKRVKPFWSIISTGLALLIIQCIPNASLVINIKTIAFVTGIIYILTVFIDICAHGSSILHFGEILLNFVISIISSILIIKYIGNPFIVLGILLITFILVIVLDFEFAFFIKREDKDEDESGKRKPKANKAKSYEEDEEPDLIVDFNTK